MVVWRRSRKEGRLDYFLDKFLAKRQINIIAGSSGSGKTTLIFQLYHASLTGGLFMGMKVPLIKWGYIAGDRTHESILETQKRTGAESLKIFSLVDQNMVGKDLTKVVIPKLPGFLGYRPELIFVDGFSSMVPDGKFNDYYAVAHWIASLQRYCTRQDLTILGAAHTPKVKEGERILDHRQSIIGSIAFGAYSEDMLVIDKVFKKDSEEKRIVHILPRNAREYSIPCNFQDGKIVPDEANEKSEAMKMSGAEFLLEPLLTPGAKFMAADMEFHAKKKGVSRATYYRWLTKLVKAKRLAKENRGEYVVLAGEGIDVLKEYEASQSTQEGDLAPTQTHDTWHGDPGEGSVQRQERISREVQSLLAKVQRRGDAIITEGPGWVSLEGPVPNGEQGSEVHPGEREVYIDEEDPFLGAATKDYQENDRGCARGD